MEIGWCDVCLRVASTYASRAFYKDLGFWKVEGSDEDGWAVVTNGSLRLGLYEARHMGAEDFTLNFRGGDIGAIAAELMGKGHAFQKPPKLGTSGAGSATLRDPDGHAIFFDTAPGEIRKDDPVAESNPVA